MLRFLSDQAVRIEIMRNNPNYVLPEFMMNLAEFREEPDLNEHGEPITVQINIPEENSKPHGRSVINLPIAKKIPAISNLSRSVLNRNRLGVISQIQSQIQKFKEVSKDQQSQKLIWISTAQTLSDLHSELSAQLSQSKKQVAKGIN